MKGEFFRPYPVFWIRIRIPFCSKIGSGSNPPESATLGKQSLNCFKVLCITYSFSKL